MKPRQLILAIIVLTAGCIGSSVIDSEGNSENDSGEAIVIPSDCTRAYEGKNPELAPNVSREFPKRPNELNQSTAKQLAQEIERVVIFNREYEENIDSLNIDLATVTAEKINNGYNVTIKHVNFNTREGSIAESDAWSAYYIISNSGVARSEAPISAPRPDDFRVVHCWNSSESLD